MGYKSQYSYLRHQIVNVLGYPSKQFEEVYDDWLGEYLGDETDRGTFYRDPDCARYKTELAVFTKYVQAEPQLEFKGRDPGYAPRDEVQDPPKVRAATRTVVTAEESPVAAAATQTVAPAKNPFARMLQGKSTGAPATTSQTVPQSLRALFRPVPKAATGSAAAPIDLAATTTKKPETEMVANSREMSIAPAAKTATGPAVAPVALPATATNKPQTEMVANSREMSIAPAASVGHMKKDAAVNPIAVNAVTGPPTPAKAKEINLEEAAALAPLPLTAHEELENTRSWNVNAGAIAPALSPELVASIRGAPVAKVFQTVRSQPFNTGRVATPLALSLKELNNIREAVISMGFQPGISQGTAIATTARFDPLQELHNRFRGMLTRTGFQPVSDGIANTPAGSTEPTTRPQEQVQATSLAWDASGSASLPTALNKAEEETQATSVVPGASNPISASSPIVEPATQPQTVLGKRKRDVELRTSGSPPRKIRRLPL
jgi:hypothetical protein